MNWDPSKHPRMPKGSSEGGQFAPGDHVAIDNGNYGHGVVESVAASGEHVNVRVTKFAFGKKDLGIAKGTGGGLGDTMQFHASRLSKSGMDRAAAIKQAKTGTHSISMQPNRPAQSYTVSRISGQTVEVRSAAGERVRLNRTASKLLLEGHYRTK